MKSTALKQTEIERRYLVPELPRMLAQHVGHRIKQGYLLHEGNREARIRAIDDKQYFLTFKDGVGLIRTEVEMEISKSHFKGLWPLTRNRQLEKTRFCIADDAHVFEIDVFEGDLAPLCLAEVEFDSVEASRKFVKPDFFGDEVTFDSHYRNAFLAAHGMVSVAACDYRIGAMPYQMVNGKLHIMLITSRSGRRWGIPKGQPESDLTNREVALMETFEEAGIIGDLQSERMCRCRIRDGRMLTVFPLRIVLIEGKWPESTVRKRELLPADEAIKRISDPELAKCVERLCGEVAGG